MILSIIEANMELMMDAEKDQIASSELLFIYSRTHFYQFGGRQSADRKIETIFQRPPDKARAVNPFQVSAAPVIGRTLPGMHLIVQCGKNRDKVGLCCTIWH